VDAPIVSRRYIRKLARAAVMSGKGRDSHGMNPWTAAAATFERRYDRLAALRKASHASHTAPVARARVEMAQGVA